MRILKQNDTTKKILFVMYDSADHVTPKTGLTPSVQISKNGAAFATASGTVSELGNGWYVFSPAAADVDTLGPLALNITATGADPVNMVYWVVAYDPYDSVALGLSNLDAAVSTRSNHTASDVWAVATRTVTGGTVDVVNNPVQLDMSQTLPATPTAGTTGNALKNADTNLDVAVSSRSSHSAADVWAVTTRTVTGGTVDTVTGEVNINLNQALPATPTADTVGAALKDADTYLDAAVSSRSTFDPTTDQVTVGVNNDKAGYQLAATEHDAIADATLKRGVNSVEASAAEHSLCTVVLAMLESQRSGSTWTIYRTDGVTIHASKTIVVDPNAEPVTKVS